MLVRSIPDCDHAFATPEREHFDKPAAMMAYFAHDRTAAQSAGTGFMTCNALWELHCHYEFVSRDVDSILPTMVDAPYVNHVPTMTRAGVGTMSAQALLQVPLCSLESGGYALHSGLPPHNRCGPDCR